MVIFTQMSGFAVLKASTICVRASVSGGVWLVQNLTTVALALQLAPVTALGSALLLAAAAADADADGDAAALSEACVPSRGGRRCRRGDGWRRDGRGGGGGA